MKISKKYQYSDIINGKKITHYGNSVDEIVAAVMRIRTKNSAKVPDYNVLYNKIKNKVGATEQVDGPGSKHFDRQVKGSPRHNPTRSRSVSIKDAETAAKALMKIIPGDYVEEDEYRRRLLICAQCPLRQRNSDCMGCGGAGIAARVAMKFRAMLGLGYKLDKRAGREFCGFCGCSLSLLLVTKVINYKQEGEDLNSQRPPSCWLKKDSRNYVG